jgi:DNA-binding NarL/FixJ family response regulator
MRLRPAQGLPPRATATSRAEGTERILAVVVVGEDRGVEARIRELAPGRRESFDVLAAVTPDRWGAVPVLPSETDVVVVTVSDGVRSLAALRDLRRMHPAWRLVVVASDIAWFEEAFELGADAWVDRAADDRTLELAITGENLIREPRRRRAPLR